jgi:hypothetical protein
MHIDSVALLAWLKARAREPSTLRGIVGLFMTMGITLDPEKLNLVLTAGITVISLINMIKRDAGSPDAKPRAR